MATTDELLKMSPHGAIVRMINDRNHTFFDGGETGSLVISPPLDEGGIRTEVEISVRRRLSGSEQLPFGGSLAFRYNRLDVENTLSGKLTGYRPAMPTSTQVLLDELTRRTGIKFDLEDFVLEDIIRSNAAPYVLKAKPESLRWIGQMEITLIDLVDLSTYLPGGLPGSQQTLKFQSPAISTKTNQPYLNVTPLRADRKALQLNSPITSPSHPLKLFLDKAVGPLGQFLHDSTSPWVVSSSATPYNLMNAALVSTGEVLAGQNPLAPNATYVMRVRLSSLDTRYGTKDLLLPYAPVDFTTSAFTPKPRLKSSAVVNASNGTPWNKWLNSLVAPSIITSLPDGMDLRISGPDAWLAEAGVPSPTNLYNAVVQYNGQRRAYDQDPYFEQCNRVIVLTVSDLNTAYQGNLTFHYRAPIVINEKMPDGVLGSDYFFALDPTEGVAPYTFTQVSGNLAPEHQLDGSNIAGPSSQTGRYSIVYDVTDAAGTTVRYALSYRVVIADLAINGTPPDATVGVAYEFLFDVSGGVPGYSYNLSVVGTPSNEVMLETPFTPRLRGTFTSAGPHTFVLDATDQKGTVASRTFTINVNP